MNTINKLRTKLTASVVVIVVLSLVAVVGGVFAYGGLEAPKMVIENIENYNEAQEVAAPAQNLGSVASPDITSLWLSVNGDTTYHIVAPFIDASTTIVSFANPFGGTATSVVEMARLDVTGVATSTFTVACGASSGPTAANSYSILSSDSIATSTTAVVENNISSTYADGAVGGGSVAKILLTPSKPYFVCNVTSAYSAAFTNAANTFDGKFTVRISQTR